MAKHVSAREAARIAEITDRVHRRAVIVEKQGQPSVAPVSLGTSTF